MVYFEQKSDDSSSHSLYIFIFGVILLSLVCKYAIFLGASIPLPIIIVDSSDVFVIIFLSPIFISEIAPELVSDISIPFPF